MKIRILTMDKINSALEFEIVKEFNLRLKSIKNDQKERELIGILLHAAIDSVNDRSSYNTLNFIGDVGD